MFDEAQTLATSLSDDSDLLVGAIEEEDGSEARAYLAKIEGTVKALRTELSTLPTATDVGESEPAGV